VIQRMHSASAPSLAGQIDRR